MTTPTTYFAGGEDTDFTLNGTVSNGASSTLFRSAWARTTLAIGNGTTVADPPASRFTTPTFTPTSAFWVHAQFGTTVNTGTSGEQALILRSPDGVSRLVLRQTGTAGTLKLSKRNAAGTITDLATATGIFGGGITALDVRVDYSASPGGIDVYLAGVLALTFSGDPRTDSATQINQADFASVNNSTSASSVAQQTNWSEIIISSGDTRGKGVWLANSSSAGNADQWTGALANVNKATINDATLISSPTAGQIQEYTLGSAPPGTFAVDAVVMSARTLVGTTGPQHFDFVTRIGGTDFLSADFASSTSFVNSGPYIQATNPNTGVAWQLSDLTAAGVNYGVESKA